MRRTRRLLLLGVMVVGAFVASPARAAACSCGGAPEDEVGPSLARADAAFVGRVERVAGEVVTLRVEQAFKARVGATVDLERSTGDVDCAPLPQAGQRVGLFAGRRDGRWVYGACAGADPDELLAAGRLARTGPPMTTLVPEVLAGLGLLAVGLALTTAARTRHDPASP